MMRYDMPFYEAEAKQLKINTNTERSVTEDPQQTAAALMSEWKEDAFDIDAIIQANGRPEFGNRSSRYQDDHQVPTFNSAANRPNALDLTRAMKYEPQASSSNCQRGQANHSPVGHQHSPYLQHPDSSGHFNYSNVSPASSASRNTTPTSPYTQALHSPVSPHHSPLTPHQNAMSPHPAAVQSPHSPHHSCSRSPSVSPVPYVSSVFGRYTGSYSEDAINSSSDLSYYGYKRSHSPGEKSDDMYRAKRERNNIAVRKSREKKKQKEIENEVRVQELTDENAKLQNKLDIVVKELHLLKSLYKSIESSLPLDAQQKLEKELARFAS